MTKAVFLDRDGVINRNCPRAHDYIKSPAEVEILPGAAEGIYALNEAGFLVIVVTNQRGVSRNMMTMADVNAVNGRIASLIAESGARIDSVYVCPHGEDECDCRKPKPGMILRAIEDYAINPLESWMVGDSSSDIAAGCAAGVKTVLVGGGNECLANYTCSDLKTASRLITEWRE